MALSPAVFLDKDGTLLVDVPYNADPAKMAYAPGVFKGLRQLGAVQAPLVVISNQPGIALGRFPARAMTAVQRRLEGMFCAAGAELAAFYWCPHLPAAYGAGGCNCRKPAPGLLLRAARDLRLDLEASWLIGDILDDVEAAGRAGCRSVLIDANNETEWRPGPWRQPTGIAADFDAAAQMVVAALRRDWPGRGRAA